MIRIKLAKAVILGVCISALSTGVVLAETGGGGAGTASQETGIDSDLLKLQSEIDQYVFDDHLEEIEDMGFKVTHTGPVDNYVEIGITPYNDKNADYLYEIFGKDNVKVVEGEEAVLFTATDAAPDAAVSTDALKDAVKTTDVDDSKGASEDVKAEVVSIAENIPVDAETGTRNKILPVAGIAGVAVLLSGAVIMAQKKKNSR